MIKLKEVAYQLLTERGRSRPMKKDDVVMLMRQKCRRFDPDKHGDIYRGTGLDADYGFIDPSKSTRKSANTKNFYTLLMDNSPKWKPFPNRGQSIICSNNADDAGWYGNTFYVIPFDGSTIGIAPSNDLWDSFDFGRSGYDFDGLEDFNMAIQLVGKKLGIEIRDNSFSALSQDLEELGERIHETPDEAKDGLARWIQQWVDGFVESGWDMQNFLLELLDPEKNRFEVQSWPSRMPRGSRREVWTDGPSILIWNGMQQEVFKEL